MAISYAEAVALTCPRCGTEFTTDSYIIVDGVERPDLVKHILDNTLHDTLCPNCGQAGRVPAPLLYHDGAHGRVLLAVPPDMPEAEWREVGQTLLWTLIGALPDAARLPYLGEVQAEAGLTGISQIIQQEQLAGYGAEDDVDIPPIVTAIQALLTAQGPAELQRILGQHTILNEPQAVTILHELAAEAIKQRQIEAADGFARAADLLEQVKAMQAQAPAQPPISIVTENQTVPPEKLEELAFALLRATTAQQLAQVVDEHPELLEDWTDEPLAEYAAAARSQNKPRVADGLEERRQAIRAMRAQYQTQQPLLEAVQAYLQAESGDEIEQIVLEREELTTDAADQTLDRLAQGARDDGDYATATFIDQRREFLRQVRSALEE